MSMTVNDLIRLLDAQENRYGGATGKPRELNVSINGNFCGCIESAKLDGYGDGLVTDVTLEIAVPKMEECYEQENRSKAIEELKEVIDSMEIYTAGRLNASKVEITVLQMQRFIRKLKEIAEQMKEVEE